MSNPVEMRQPVETPGVGGLGRLLASTGVSIAGQGMVLAAVPLLAASLTRNPVGVSLTVAAGYAAWLAVGLPAGALVDRWPRRRTMVLADIARAVLLAGLAIAVALDVASLWMLVLVVFAIGVASCFFDPAAQAAIPQVVGREPSVLARANSRLWSLDLVGRSLIGPPLGAALFALAMVLPFAGNALTFVVSALLLAGLGGIDRSGSRSAVPAGVRDSVREGVRFLWRHRELRALTLGMASFNLTYNIAFAPLVLFAQDRLHLGDRGFGLLLAMIAIGGLLGAWLAPRIQRRMTSTHAYAFGLLAQGIAWGAMWLWPNRWLAGAALAANWAGQHDGHRHRCVSAAGPHSGRSLGPRQCWHADAWPRFSRGRRPRWWVGRQRGRTRRTVAPGAGLRSRNSDLLCQRPHGQVVGPLVGLLAAV